MAQRSKKKKGQHSQRLRRGTAYSYSHIWTPLLLGVIAFLAFWPSLSSDLVYDAHKEIIDEGFITSFSNLPSVLSLKVLSMNLMLGDRPGELLYLMLIAVFSGTVPFGYHFCSNLLHALNVALFFVLMLRLMANDRVIPMGASFLKVRLAAVAVTLFFALHPIVVESVAEVSYSSSLLVTFFTFLTLVSATLFDPGKLREAGLVGALGVLCALAAVTSKESGVAAALLLIAYWFLFRRREAIAPWLSFIGTAMLVTLSFLAARFYYAPPNHQPVIYLGGSFSQVLSIQPRLWVFMMGKVFWPTQLSADYTPVENLGPPAALALAILAAVLLLQTWLAGKSKIGALGAITYWIGLATVSNFIPLYRPLADRFYYLPLVGVGMQLLALLIVTLPSPRIFWGLTLGLTLALVPLTVLTVTRQYVFADNFSLWSETLEVSPDSAVAHTGLGWELYQQGRLDEATTHYKKAIEINPKFAEVHNNYGLALMQKGETDNAIVEYEKALELNSNTAEIPNNLGLALAQRGKVDEAIAEYEKSIAINPAFVNAHNDLGMAFAQKRENDEAINEYQKALELAPNQAETHNNLAIIFAQKGQLNAAIAEFREAVRLKPDYSTAQDNLIKAIVALNQKK